jgi:Dyp-type peroxidase family
MKPAQNPPDYSDVQGFVRRGYGKLTEACYALLKVTDAAPARDWIERASITSADKKTDGLETAVQIAFTAVGLKELGVPADVIAGFSPEFIAGLAGDPNRSRRLGDVGESAPARRRWGAGEMQPDLVVMLFALPGMLEELQRRCSAEWAAAFRVMAWLDTSNMGGHEPFGFKDGVSQPYIDWDRERHIAGDQVTYQNIVALGEFLLGYPNEYGKYTERPVIDPGGAAECLLAAEDQPVKRDLGRNGTYLVMRQLEQDVPRFWEFAMKASGGDSTQADTLAASFVGRTQSGTPLASAGRTIPGVQDTPSALAANGFTFDEDPNGVRCPIGAHVRRTNPRNADLPTPPPNPVAYLIAKVGLGPHPPRSDLLSSTRFHRILRRGREYGQLLTPADAKRGPADSSERGLHFACINANILRQFEFLQNAWIMATKFNGLTDESDPLLGNRAPVPGCAQTNAFTVQRERNAPRRIADLPQFVRVRGGAYFFMPSLRALKFIARVGAQGRS